MDDGRLVIDTPPDHRPEQKDTLNESLGGTQMNQDVFEGRWKEMRGLMKEWWGRLTDDDLEQAGGNAEQIIGLLQQRYGYTRERAEEEFNRRIMAVKEALKNA